MFHILSIIFFYFLTHQISTAIHVENITVTRGEQVKFHCQFPSNFSAKENIIQWKKSRFDEDNVIISINGRIPQIFVNSYQTNLTHRSSSFDVFHVDRQDSTTYICQTFETQTILCQYNLIVLIKPEAPLLTINQENIEEYQAVTLTCTSFNGNPAPEYTWYRNGTLLPSLTEQVMTTGNRSIYTFNVTRFDNQIKYECQIWNQALASPLLVEQYLHVKYRPYVKILEVGTIFSSIPNQIRKIIAIEQRAQNLTCHFDANPPPISIYWLTNETTIVSRESVVYMPRLIPEQSGIYTCIVENSIGKENQSIYLDVEYGPRVRAVHSRILVNRSDPIELRCLADSNPPPYQTIWLKNNTQIFRGNQLSSLHFDRTDRNDSGLYTCLVYNRFSNNETTNSSSTMELIVQSRPIIETTHTKIAVEIDQSATLTCRVFAQPKPHIIWKHNGEILPCDEVVNDRCYLRFSKMTKKDFGVYQCVAENLLGREEWTYQIVSRGKPETPTDIIVSEITASSFRIQFSPAFDGGSGSQQVLVQVINADNSSIMNQQIPLHTQEYIVKGLNESTLYKFRIRATNMYGDSPWSNAIPVQTSELIVTTEDLPQLHVISYHSKDHSLQFDYLPRSMKLSEERLCLNLRQSSDGNNYRSFEQCLPIRNHRVAWEVEKDFPYLRLSVCSKKHPQICGLEMEMKEELNNRNFTAMIIGIVVMANFLVLVVIIVIGIKCCRLRKQRLESKMKKFSISGLDKGVKPIISEPRLQNPYLLYSNTNSHMSPYDYEYQQRQVASSFAHSCDVVDREQNREELEYGTAIRTATIRTSPHWKSSDSRSGSNPSSEASCGTQNTNILYTHTDTRTNPTNSVVISHYGFPPILSPLKQHSTTLIQSSSSSSESSTPSRMQKLFYEVVV